MPDLPQRHTIRRPGYDYTRPGAYYLTICTYDRRHWFGHIAVGVVHPSPIGEWAQRCWNAIPEHMPHVDVGEFVVMPNHVHGIVVIRERLVDGVPDLTPDDPGTEMPGGPSRSFANAHGQRTRARQDAPLREPRKPPGIPRGALGQVVASYKSAVTRMAYRDGLVPHGTPIWQRNYWDRVIRNDCEYDRIARYIQDNPKNWKRDRFNWP